MAAGGQVYLPPTAELLQGDIYRNVPSIHLAARPVSVTRYHKNIGERVLHGIHSEAGPAPQDGYRWRPEQGGESVLAKGFRGMAIVLTHDCEIENDPDHRLVAQIRPITEIQAAHRPEIRALHHWAAFPLPASDEPLIVESFVDFRRITSMRPEALPDADRVGRLEPVRLDALRVRFWQFLNRLVLEPPGAVQP